LKKKRSFKESKEGEEEEICLSDSFVRKERVLWIIDVVFTDLLVVRFVSARVMMSEYDIDTNNDVIIFYSRVFASSYFCSLLFCRVLFFSISPSVHPPLLLFYLLCLLSTAAV
jgi:hypothetical protein